MVRDDLSLRKVSFISVLAIAFYFSSCIKDKCKDDVLTHERVNYNGFELRTNGYYYSLVERNQFDGDIYNLFIFFRNGVVNITSATGSDAIAKTEQAFIDGSFYNGSKNIKPNWGVFEVRQDSLQVEQWVMKYCGYPVTEWKAYILNDSTFVSYSDTFHFKQFCCKPDSTNDFIR